MHINVKIIFGILTLFSFKAMACPNFTGTYACPDDEKAEIVTISQKRDARGAIVYTVQEENEINTYVANGMEHPLQDDLLVDATYRAQCFGNAVYMQIKGIIPQINGNPGYLVENAVFTLDEQGHLQETEQTFFNHRFQSVEVETCRRL